MHRTCRTEAEARAKTPTPADGASSVPPAGPSKRSHRAEAALRLMLSLVLALAECSWMAMSAGPS
eukprot:6542272-Alexandrium_andersonii.AAC.1